jgi:hypothetical protein
VATGKERGLKRADGVEIVQYRGGSCDGKFFAFQTGFTDKDARFHIYETATDEEHTITPPVPGVLGVTTDGKSLLMRTRDGSFFIMDAAGADKEARKLGIQVSDTSSMMFSPDSSSAAVVDDNGIVRFADLGTGWETPKMGENLERKEDVFRRNFRWGGVPLAISPDGRTVATEGKDNSIVISEVASGKTRRKFTKGHQSMLTCLAFTPDGNTLISTSKEGTILFWDMTTGEDSHKAGKLTDKQLDDLWSDLMDDDAAKAGRALCILRAAPHASVPFIATHLKPAASIDHQKLDELLKDVQGTDADKAKSASDALEKFGDQIEPALRRLIAAKPAAEVQKRIEPPLRKLLVNPLSGQSLREVRAVEVLEQIGTAEARGILKDLAGDAEDARLTRNARAALARLKRDGDAGSGSPDSSKGSAPPAEDKKDPLPPGARLSIGRNRLVHPGPSSIGFTPDSERVVSIGTDGLVRLWNASTGMEALRIDPRDAVAFDKGDDVLAFDVAANGKLLGAIVKDKGVLLYDLPSGKARTASTSQPAAPTRSGLHRQSLGR